MYKSNKGKLRSIKKIIVYKEMGYIYEQLVVHIIFYYHARYLINPKPRVLFCSVFKSGW